LARQNIGFVQGEKPVRSEEGIRPATVITVRATEAGSLLPLAQDRSQPPPNKSVHIAKR